MWQASAGTRQPGKAQWVWRVVTARRRCAGIVGSASPVSRGSGMPSGRPDPSPGPPASWDWRSHEASPPGPDSTSAARRSIVSRSRRTVCGASGRRFGARAAAARASAAVGPVGTAVAGQASTAVAGRARPSGGLAGRRQNSASKQAASRPRAGSVAARTGLTVSAILIGPGSSALSRGHAALAVGVGPVHAQAVGGEVELGEPVEGGLVHVAGHDRHERAVAGGGFGLGAGQPAGLRRPGGKPGALHPGCTGGAAQPGQRDVQVSLGRLAGPARQHATGDQAPARLLQRVMTALPAGAGVLGPGLLA